MFLGPTVLLAPTTDTIARFPVGVSQVHQDDLAYWIRNGHLSGIVFANSDEETEFLLTYKDISRNDYA